MPSVHSVFLSVYGAPDAGSLPTATPMFPRLHRDRNGSERAENRPENQKG